MKRGKILMAVLVVLAVLFASCSTHLSEAEGAQAKVVAVTLSLGGEVDKIAQKAVDLAGGVNTATFRFFYKAKAQWASSAPIQGDTGDNFVEIVGKTVDQMESGVSLGYFKPGIWQFDVQIRASNGTTIIYQAKESFRTAYKEISKSQLDLEADMELYTAAGTGTVTIKLAVPKVVVDAAPDVTLTSGAFNSGEEATIDNTPDADYKTGATAEAVKVAATKWYYFEKEISGITPGNYDFVFKYYKNTTHTIANQIGGATVSMTVFPGVTDYIIWGTIENGEYQLAQLTLTVPAVTVNFVSKIGGAGDNVNAVPKGDSLVCTATASAGATLTWSINGFPVTSGLSTTTVTNDTFTFSTSTVTADPPAYNTNKPGEYEIMCKATKGGVTSYYAKTVYVAPSIDIVSRIDGAGADVNTFTTAQNLVCVPVIKPYGSTLTWYVDGTEVTVGVDGNGVFTYGAGSTPVASAANHTISFKAIKNDVLLGVGSKAVTVTTP